MTSVSGMRPPWRDRHGRLIPIKAVTLALVCLPAIILMGQLATGDLEPRELQALIHGTGLWTVRLMLVTLAITPFRVVLNWPKILLVRRLMGVTTGVYGLTHLALYCADQNFAPLHIALEIVQRMYLTIGFTALLGLTALTVTSTDTAVKRLGANWKRLHRLAYPIAVLMLLHFFMQSKANVGQAVFPTGVFLWLMLWRSIPMGWHSSLGAHVLIALLAGFGAAGLECAWYGLNTHIPVERVLLSNLNVAFGLRPPLWVGIAGLGVAALALVMRQIRPPRRAVPPPVRTPARHAAPPVGGSPEQA